MAINIRRLKINALGRAFLGVAIGFAPLATSAFAEDQPPAAAAPAKRTKKPHAQPASLEARHRVCLAFIQRHGLSCDPWIEPTCGGDTGYFRPLECVRPRAQ